MTAILQNGIPGQIDYNAQWFTLAGTSQGAATTMAEGYPGTYTANPPAMASSTAPYILVIKKGTSEEGRTDYFWDGTREINPSFVRDRLAAIVGEVWTATTRSLTDKVGYALSTAGVTAIWAETTRTLTSFGTLAADVWSSATRSLTATVTTDAASRAVVTQLNTDFLALLAADKSRFTATALINAPTGSGGGGGATAGDIAAAVWTNTTRSLTDKIGYELTAAERTAIGTSVWGTTTRALTDKAGFALSGAERTAIWSETTRTLTGFGTLAADVWSSTTRSLNVAVTTDAASRTASQATGFATPASVTAVITAGDARWVTGNTVAPDNALLTQLNTDFLGLLVSGDKTRFTGTALSNSPGGGSGGATSGDIATAVWAATTRSLNVPVATDEASRIASQATGFNTVIPDNAGIAILTALIEDNKFTADALSLAPTGGGGSSSALTTEQATQLRIAAARVTNRIKADSLTNVETLYDSNGTTPLVQRSLRGIDGLPNSEDVYESLPV